MNAIISHETAAAPIPVPALTVAQPAPSPAAAPGLPSVLCTLELLSDVEQIDMFTCEAAIETVTHSFVDTGMAFAGIRDSRLYRQEFDSFEVYCRQRWQYGRHYVNRLVCICGTRSPASDRANAENRWLEGKGSGSIPQNGLTEGADCCEIEKANDDGRLEMDCRETPHGALAERC